MRVKKDILSKNEYIAAEGVWVRNFTKENVRPLSLSKIIKHEDYNLLLTNEKTNHTLQLPGIANERFHFPKIIIVSDGHDFETRHQELLSLPDVAVLAVNGALASWKLMGATVKKPINFYVVNNPYQECCGYIPKRGKYYPACIASSRTNPKFLREYPGRKFTYESSPTRYFGEDRYEEYYIDDYRNPVCAAIGLAYRFGVEKLMLMCCDDSFVDERPGSVKMNNGLWTYPQHLKSQKIIDANLYWLKTQQHQVSIADYSSGPEYINAGYIGRVEEAIAFFQDEEPHGI